MDGAADVAQERRIVPFELPKGRLGLLESWYVAEYPALLRFAYFLTGDKPSAEDLVQESFARLCSAAGRIEPDGLTAYARRTILNLQASAFRRRGVEERFLRRFRSRGDAAEAHDVASGVDMRRALMTLPPRRRALLALRYYEDMKESDIAVVMGMSLAAVKKEIERAKRRLRDELGERGKS